MSLQTLDHFRSHFKTLLARLLGLLECAKLAALNLENSGERPQTVQDFDATLRQVLFPKAPNNGTSGGFETASRHYCIQWYQVITNFYVL
jgi:hypothetical protein